LIKYNLGLFAVLLGFFSCTKPVQIDLPQLAPQLVVDGNIEAGSYPIVLLSISQPAADTVSLLTYLNSVVSDAQVNVINATDTFALTPTFIQQLPLESQKRVAEMLRLELEEVLLLPIQVYTSTALIGEPNHTYALHIQYKDKTFTGSTYLPSQAPLDTLYWKRETAAIEYGFSWARLTDPASSSDAYRWEVRRIDRNEQGQDLDPIFRRARGGIFSDEFFNGQAIEFYFQNPLKRKDSTHLKAYRRYYRFGDSVVVKLSKMDPAVYLYYDRMDAQLDANSNPYATPINIPSNMKGCLGIWAGFSPWYDTLICID
jgi:hypothetical protein